MTLSDLKNIFRLENRTRYFVPLLACLSVSSIILFAVLVSSSYRPDGQPEAREARPFENVRLAGRAAMVYDVVSGKELFSKNPDMPLPLASLTKVLTAIIADKKLDNDLKIKIEREYLEPEGDSLFLVGDTWRAADLRDFTLLTSSNDGAFALAAVSGAGGNGGDKEAAESEFVKEMNSLAQEIGMQGSKFFNEHGLDREAEKGGAYGTARDMVTLFEYTLRNYPEVLEVTRYKNVNFMSAARVYPAGNTNILVDQIPNLIASKTGYTDLAGGNLIVALDAGLNRPIIVSVLGSTSEGRFSDVLQLVEAALKELSAL